MQRTAFLAAAAALWLFARPCLAAPLAAYGELPSIESAALSTDGATLALATTDGEKRALALRRTSDGKTFLTIRVGDSKLRDLRWAGPDHLLVTISVTGLPPELLGERQEWFEIIDINLKTRTEMNVLGAIHNGIRASIGAPSVRILGGQPYAFVRAFHFVDSEGRVSLFRVNLATGETVQVAEGKPDTDDWLVGWDGQPLAESRYDPKGSSWRLLVRRGDGWPVVDSKQTGYGDDNELGLGRDGRSVLIGRVVNGYEVLRELAPGAVDWGAPFDAADAQDLIFDPLDERLIGDHALAGETDVYKLFAPADQAIWDGAAKLFPGARVTLADLSADHHKLLVRVDAPATGPRYALVDADAHTSQDIGSAFAKLTPDDIATVQPVAFTAKDGLDLTGYLTLPRGRDPKGLPLVVFPHGGPATRDEPGFDWWAQAMAAQGYAVLQVNYRGSDGFGEDFLEAGFGEWGRKMQTDLSDGVRYLAAQGTIDPKRVCIVGASYGGYAALAGATLDPGVYRCAVSVAGPSDLRKFVDWSKERSDIASQRYWTRYMGVAGPDDPRLAQISPVDHVDAVSIPMLLIHGKDDTVVPFEQSQMMVDALKRAGKPVDFVVLKHEDHWLSQGDTRLQMLQATIDFLEKNNPPG